jgi:hypothetical protein
VRRNPWFCDRRHERWNEETLNRHPAGQNPARWSLEPGRRKRVMRRQS